MRRMIEIKGHHINEGRPMICVPIVAAEKDEILEQTRIFVDHGARMIEWRLDFFEHLADDEAIQEVLAGLHTICEKTVLLVTIRSKRQGGNVQMQEQELIRLFELLAKSRMADMIDVEFFELTRPQKVIEKMQREGCCVITSHHDFHETPDYEVMMTLLEQMRDGGADVVKLAVMPQNASDVLSLLQVTNDFYEQNEEVPVISMSMGKLGRVSRLCGHTFGSCVTFAVMGEASAPGQPLAKDLEQMLDFMDAEN